MTPGQASLQGEQKGAQHRPRRGRRLPSSLSPSSSSPPSQQESQESWRVVSVSLGQPWSSRLISLPPFIFFPAWETSYFRSRAEETLAAEKPEETWLKAGTASHQFIGVPGCGPALGAGIFGSERLFGLRLEPLLLTKMSDFFFFFLSL